MPRSLWSLMSRWPKSSFMKKGYELKVVVKLLKCELGMYIIVGGQIY